MKQQFLGDSYDAVKRLWQEAFAEWAPLLAEPRYVPNDIRSDFTTVTRIPILDSHRPPVYSIFNDPDTGIRFPDRQNQKEGTTHINLATIAKQLTETAVRCVVTFDQSHHRELGFSPADQRNAKASWLRAQGLHAFYYVSHAPFLFAFSDGGHMETARNRLLALGIPAARIEVSK
ncbi:MAG: hypothetical protein KGJ32_15145 [Xanthomonadaceae bacterium]|nr:hypothetical protein [Xanthomonadaceae bacterium]